MHKEIMTMSETFKSNQTEVKHFHSKLLAKDEEIIRSKQTDVSKGEHVKLLKEH